MLVLSRRKNEAIVINDNITIVVVEIRGDKVRLGIEAPGHVPVYRAEIQEKREQSGIDHQSRKTRKDMVKEIRDGAL